MIVWEVDNEYILIDGHNRFRIVGLHPTLRFNIRRMQFADRNEAKLWIIDNQLGKRNLLPYDKVLLNSKKKAILSKQAREISNSNLKKGCSDSQKSDARGRVDEQIGKASGVSRDTVRKVEAIQNSGNEQLINDVREGRETINSAYRIIHPKKTPYQQDKEFLAAAKQEHEDFKASKTVSIHDVQVDKTNRKIIAIDLYNRLMRMGKCIDDVVIDMEEGAIDLKEMSKTLTPEAIKSLRTTIRFWFEKLAKIDKEIKIG
ncbi:MAG: hypothetical protein IKG04_02265 [Exiguobacterium sp.]|nr:hypothetical protein [Exiguobacterium sp.]